MRHFSASALLALVLCLLPGSAWALSWSDTTNPLLPSILENNGTYIAVVGVTATESTSRTITLSVSTPTAGSAYLTVTSGSSSVSSLAYFAPPADFAGTATFVITASVPFQFPYSAASITKTVQVTVIQVNDPPTFTLAGSHTTAEDSGAQSVANFASGFNPGGSGYESGQSALPYIVTTANPDFFSVQPAIDAAGTLTYTPAPNRAGSTTISVQAKDNGGTASGGIDTSGAQTSTIVVTGSSDGRLYATVAGGGNGLSWASPFTLRQAMAYSSAGEEIWVAEGIHKPGTLRTDAFQLRSGVNVYGGFAGTETALGQRDVRAHPTILSGDLGTAGVTSDNAYHVIEAKGNGLLDGFTVRDGNANGTGDLSYGGGLYGNGQSPTVRDCLFTANTSTYVGGAVCVLSGNTSNFQRVVFAGNTGAYGGAIFLHGDVTMANCVMQGNSATTDGGAVRTVGNVTMTNCTLYGNSAPAGSAAIAMYGNLTMTNSIVWQSTPTSLLSGSGTSTVNASIIQGGLPSGFTGSASAADPLFVAIGDPDGPDNKWSTGDDGLALQPLSPGRDAGASNSLTEDLRGAVRPSGPAVDIGAYERRVAYVVPGGAGAATGASWATASGDLAGILGGTTSSDEVWVKAGTYKPTSGANRSASFALPAGVGLYGGFNGTETVRDARDWTQNRVTLSGDIGAGGNASDNTYTLVVPSGSGSTINGFILRDGNANIGGSGLRDGGGAIYLANASTSVRNCVFVNNAGTYAGGAIFCQANGQVTVENSLFTGNSAQYGGAIEVEIGGSQATIVNSTFVGNSASVHGDAVETASTSLPIFVTNCIAWANGSREDIYHAGGAQGTITNSLVQGSGGSGAWQSSHGTNGGGNLDVDPQFFAGNDPDGADNLFFTADDGLLLLTGSPAANSGIAAGAPSADIRRKSRPLGTGIDMGCYEGQLGRVSFATASSVQSESAGNVQVTVNVLPAADEPMTVNWAITGGSAINGVAVGNSTSGGIPIPFYTYYYRSRTTSVYLASELGPDAQFNSLTFDMTGLPDVPLTNLNVRVKQTPLTDLGSSDWGDGTGWTTVYAGDLTIAAVGPLTLNFGTGSSSADDGITGFNYSATQNLLVDVSFDNPVQGGQAGVVRYTYYSGTVRTLYQIGDLSGAAPLDWTNASPAPYTYAGRANVIFGKNPTGGRADYTATTTGILTFAPGETAKGIPVTILQDQNDEPTETITFALSSPVGGVLGSTTAHTLFITDDDAVPTVQFAAASSSGGEAIASPTFGVTLSAQSDRDVTVDYARAAGANGGNADISGTDGSLTAGTLTFPAGTVQATIGGGSVAIADDDRDEDNETLGVALSNPGLSTLGSPSLHTYTIVDNDTSALVVSKTAVQVTENDPTADTFTVRLATRPHEGGNLVRVDFACSNSAEAEVSVDGSTWSQTGFLWFAATANGSANGSSALNAAAWNSALTVRVRSVDDTAVPVVDGDVVSDLAISINAGGTTDTRYDAVSASHVAITTHDDDVADFVITPLQPAPVVTPLPVNESYAYRWAHAVSGNVVTVYDDFDAAGDISGIYPGTTVYSYNDGIWTTVRSIGAGFDVTLDAPVSAGSELLFGYAQHFQVTLKTKPTADVKVSFTLDDPSLFFLSQSSATIQPANWNTGVTIWVYANDDVIDQDADGDQTNDFRDTGMVIKNEGSTDPAYQTVDPADLAFRLYDNDVRGVFFDPVSVDLVEGGASATYGISLATEPTGTVTITPQVSGAPQVGVSGGVTFDNTNWYLTQYITVTPLDDADFDPTATDTISHTVTATGDYAPMTTAGSVGVTFSGDNDNPFPVVTPTAGLFTGEDGSTATFTVQLGSRPAPGDVVTVPFSTGDPAEGQFTGAVNSIALSFARTAIGTGTGLSAANAAAWNAPVTVTLVGVDDSPASPDGDIPYTIIGGTTTSSTGSLLGGRTVPSVSVTNRDDETTGIRLTASPLSLTEGGSGVYHLQIQWLGTDPQNVDNAFVIALTSSSPDITFSPSVVTWTGKATDATFTAVKDITVTAVDDSIDEPLETASISHTVIYSTDTVRFPTNLQIPDAKVSIIDNDIPGIDVAPTSLTTVEGGPAGSISVRLRTQPVGTVTIGLSVAGDTDEVVLGAPNVSFNATDWSTPKFVSVTPVDDDIVDGDRTYTIVTAAATVTDATGDAGYLNLGSPDVLGTNIDDDAVGIALSKSALILAEGDAGGVGKVTDSYTIALQSAPTGTVSILLGGSGQTSFTIPIPGPSTAAVTTVYFAATASGDGSGKSSADARLWSSALTITVMAIPDAIDEASPLQAQITHTVSGGDYAGLPVAPIIASITDAPDAAYQVGFALSTSTVTVAEGASSTALTVALKSKPTAAVTVTVSSANGAVATASPTTITFTPINWSSAQTVTIAGTDDQVDQDTDGNQANDTRSTSITLVPRSTDPAYDALAAASCAVTVTDNDAAAVIVTASSGISVTEGGGTATFTVVLAKQPTAAVNIPLTVDNTQRATVSPASLTFTAANWNVPQTVTVAGRDQDGTNDAANGSTTITVQTGDPTSSDYPFNLLTATSVADVLVSVLPSNAPPRITAVADFAIAEDATTLLTLTGIDAGQSGEVQVLTISAASNNPGLIPNPLAVTTMNGGAATGATLTQAITLVPAADASGIAVITVTVTDDATIGSDAALATVMQFTVTVGAVNDRPVVATSGSVPQHVEGQAATPVLASVQLTDIDSTTLASAQVRIVNPLDGTYERLQASGAGTAIIPAFDPSISTLTLTAPTPQPIADFQTVLRTVAYRTESDNPTETPDRQLEVLVHDGTDQSLPVTAAVSVVRSNDPPVLSGTVDPIPAVAEDILASANAGIAIDNLLSANVVIGDPDGSSRGVAITGTGGTVPGVWQFSLNNGTAWTTFPGLGSGLSLPLLADGGGLSRIRFQPSAQANGTVEVSFRAWDGSDAAPQGTVLTPVAPGSGTSAYSSAILTANLSIDAVNDAPVLAAANALPAVDEDSSAHTGISVANLLVGQVTDIDAAALGGLIIVAADNSDGAWQFSVDGGSIWTAVGTVSSSAGIVLAVDGENTRVRFVPAQDYNGSAPTIGWKAWDRSDGIASGTTGVNAASSGGTSAFSATTVSAAQTVLALNDAPVLSGLTGSAVIGSVVEDILPAANAGVAVSTVLSAMAVSDVDAGAIAGIAVVAVDNTNGQWQFSLDSGANWTSFGSVSAAAARLLQDVAGNRVRFQPGANFTGTAPISVQAWDDTSGTDGGTGNASVSGGTSAFSDNAVTLQISVTPANDPPTIDLNLVDLATRDMTAPAHFDEGSLPQVVTTSGVSVTDIDSTTLAGGTITLLDRPDGAVEKLDVNISGLSMTASWNQATWTLTLTSGGSTTPAEYQQLLTTLTYANSSETPTAGVRRIRVTLNDGSPSNSTASADALVQVYPLNDLPVLRVGGRLNLILGASLAIKSTGEDANLNSVLDSGEDTNANGILDEAIIQVTDADTPLNALTFTVQLSPNLGKLYKNGGTQLLANGSTFTVADLAAGLEYRHDGLLAGVDGFAIKVNDGNPGGDAIGIVSLTVAGLVPPQVGVNDATPALWIEDITPPVRLDANAYIIDTDSANFGGGSIIIANPGGRAGDEIAFDPALVGNVIVQSGLDLTDGPGGVVLGTLSGGFNADPLVIGLSADCTPAIAQTILRGMTWINGGNNPGADPEAQETRVLTITVNDGVLSSVPVTRTITVDPVDDPPDLLAYTLSLTPGLTVTGQLEAVDPEGEAVTFALGTPLAANGVVTLQPDGSFTYEHQILGGVTDTFGVVVTEAGAGGQSVTGTVQVVVTVPDASAPRIVSAAPVRAEPGVIFTYTPVLAGFGTDLEYKLLPGLQDAVTGAPVGFASTFSGGTSGSGATGTIRINAPTAPPGGYVRTGLLVIDRVSGKSAYQPILIKIAVGVSG